MSPEKYKNRRIFLYGLPGTGKTTVGKILADRLGLLFDDLDALVENNAGSSIARLFELEGEEGFRRREAQQLNSWIENHDGVLALGGGALLHPASLDLAQKSGMVICLTASKPELLRRLEKTGRFTAFIGCRRPIYPIG